MQAYAQLTTLDFTDIAGANLNEEWGRSIAQENAVVVVSRKGCCMGHVVTRLLCSLGVNPRVVEIVGAEEQREEIPAIFIGGRLLGGVDRLLAAHISGNLVPQLKEAGALWL